MDHAGLLIMKEMQIGLFLYMITEESSYNVGLASLLTY